LHSQILRVHDTCTPRFAFGARLSNRAAFRRQWRRQSPQVTMTHSIAPILHVPSSAAVAAMASGIRAR